LASPEAQGESLEQHPEQNPEQTPLIHLWTFENPAKASVFINSLQYAGIIFEARTKSAVKDSSKGAGSEVTIMVDEDEYERAKKLLIKHRKRRTAT